jgi:anaerobic magnesium-protoporphyrin IX monomethyl ester cyclase
VMNRDVCLITPPSLFLLDERVFMSLGILRVAAVLEQAGIRVEVVDLSGVENFEEAIRAHAAASESNVFGVTATTPQLPAAIAVSRAIREVRPAARIILGGPHVTLVNAARRREESMAVAGRATRAFERLYNDFDILVAGDGEKAIFQALDFEAPKLLDADVPKSPLFLTPAELTKLPMPARHLVDGDSYRYTIDGVRALSLICQLGCPFGCRFCGGRNSPSLRRVRLRPAESVVAEIVRLHTEYGVNGFMLYDDELNVNPRMVDLMKALERESQKLGTEFRFRGFVKSELFNDEQAAAMYRAGFRWILAGFESGSQGILANIDKRATTEDNARCVEIAHKHGLKVKALMSVGHPGESRDSIMDTREWLLKTRPDDFDITVLSVYPGSPYYDDAVPHDGLSNVWVYTVNGERLYSFDIDYTVVSDYYKGAVSSYTAYVYTDNLTPIELAELRDFVETDIRKSLGIPFNKSAPSIRYEHSMGQKGLPSHILRTSSDILRASAKCSAGCI